jgi:NDP-sugar pyrophosphorylase family protein
LALRVIIPTAGTGSRLFEKTKFINKSLVEIGNKPAISHIINMFPESTEFVIALGYKGTLVKEYLSLAYPNKKFFFKFIKPYVGKNSGLGITLLQCKKFLQKPFLFVSCDSIIPHKIKKLESNWVGYGTTKDISNYRSLKVKKKLVISFLEKNKKSKSNKAYIGLAGIKDYKVFWSELSNNKDKSKIEGEILGLKAILKKSAIKTKKFTWYDTGNLNSYNIAKKKFFNKNQPIILEKSNESIWFFKKFVIKFSNDRQFISKRIKRSKIINNFVPKILAFGKNMYKYQYVDGRVLSSILSIPLFKSLLFKLKEFWLVKKLDIKKNKAFNKNCFKFYYLKSLQRISLFYFKSKKNDQNHTINGIRIPKLSKLFKKIDWKFISSGLPGRFHGDLHFENIIFNKVNKRFTFLDWRQDFENDIRVGDIYYDLAKLMHGIIVSHEQVNKNRFKIYWKKDIINFSITKSKTHKASLIYFEKWLKNNGYDVSKVRIITSLIFLNIAPLHHHPYSLFLYALGKSMLFEELSKNDNYK